VAGSSIFFWVSPLSMPAVQRPTLPRIPAIPSIRCTLGPVDGQGFTPESTCDSRLQIREEAVLRQIRLVLSDRQWQRIEKHCVGKPEDPGGTGADNRKFVEAVLWIVRTGSPWRDVTA